MYVQDAINEFNSRINETGMISESDLVSVSVLPVTSEVMIHDPEAGSKRAFFEVIFVYWRSHPA